MQSQERWQRKHSAKICRANDGWMHSGQRFVVLRSMLFISPHVLQQTAIICDDSLGISVWHSFVCLSCIPIFLRIRKYSKLSEWSSLNDLTVYSVLYNSVILGVNTMKCQIYHNRLFLNQYFIMPAIHSWKLYCRMLCLRYNNPKTIVS